MAGQQGKEVLDRLSALLPDSLYSVTELCNISSEMETTYAELPPQLLNEVSNVIHDHTTGLFRFTTSPDGKEIAQFIGSGTFVVCSNTFGILTAGHVVECLKNPFFLGLGLKGGEQKCTIDSNILTIREVARGKDDSTGPDLGLIILPESAIGWIKAKASFYNLDLGRQRALTEPMDADIQAVALCGIPDVLTTEQSSERGFSALRTYQQRCSFGSVGKVYIAGDFDYCEAEINYDNKPPCSKLQGIKNQKAVIV